MKKSRPRISTLRNRSMYLDAYFSQNPCGLVCVALYRNQPFAAAAAAAAVAAGTQLWGTLCPMAWFLFLFRFDPFVPLP